VSLVKKAPSMSLKRSGYGGTISAVDVESLGMCSCMDETPSIPRHVSRYDMIQQPFTQAARSIFDNFPLHVCSAVSRAAYPSAV
jgi:hypothetical protein